MNNWKNRITIMVMILGMGVTGIASATNGYMTHGTGTKNKGMAGAGIALPEDAISTVNNPAVAVLVGDSMELGAALFNPNRSYEIGPSQAMGNYPAYTFGQGEFDSDSNYFVIPHFARSWQRDDESAFALAFYGRGGMNTDWQDGAPAMFDPDGPGPGPVVTLPGTFGAGDAGVDLSQAFLDLTWAKKMNDTVSLGVTGIFAMQIFEAKGLNNFQGFTETFNRNFQPGMQPPPVSNLTNNGHEFSWGYGARVGLHAALSDTVSFGISYQSKIFMSELDDYADLFAEEGDFDIPADFKAGLTFQATDTMSISVDVEHIWFSDVDSVGNRIQNLFNCPAFVGPAGDFEVCLGGDKGAGFGWDDMTVFKIGAQWEGSDGWTWRAGYSNGSHPIDDDQMTFNILAPAVMEDHLTFGFTKELENGNELNFSFLYAPEVSQSGLNNFDPTQTVGFEMDQFELELSYGWK